MSRTTLLILNAGRESQGHNFTDALLEESDDTWELEQHAYGQPDVFSFTLRSSELDLVNRIANKEVRLELRDHRGAYLDGSQSTNPSLSDPGWDSVVIDRMFGGIITEIATKRRGFEMDYNCKALGWIHLLENILVSASFTGNTSDRETLVGRPDTNSKGELSGIFERLEEADNSLNVDEDLRADIRCRVRVTATGEIRDVVIRSYDEDTQELISIGEYYQDVYLRLSLDTAKESLDKIASLSDAEWRVDPNKVLWFLAPETDSLDGELVLGDGTEPDNQNNNTNNKEVPVFARDYRQTRMVNIAGSPLDTSFAVGVPRPIANRAGTQLLRFSVTRSAQDGLYELNIHCDESLTSNDTDYVGYSIRVRGAPSQDDLTAETSSVMELAAIDMLESFVRTTHTGEVQ